MSTLIHLAIIIIVNLSVFDLEWLEEFEDTTRPIRICKSKDRQHNVRKIPQGLSESVNQRTDNIMAKRNKTKDLKQLSTNHTYKTEDRVTRTPLKSGVNSGVPEG